MATVPEVLNENRERYLSELMELLRVPSVSADPDHREDLGACAELVAGHLRKMGFATEIVPTRGKPGHPLVLGTLHRDPSLPTVLVYGHYDVQPPDPLELWQHGAFNPTVVDGDIIARGATDDKGQIFAHLKGVESLLAAAGRLPVNLTLAVEGEEEVGSAGIIRFLEEHPERLRCDAIVISDSAQYAPGVPAVCYGLRGILAMEVRVDGPSRDLHSGQFGGAVANPAEMLARLLATLKSADGRIAVDGFYDDVRPLSGEERRATAALPFDEASYLAEIGAPKAFGEPGYSTLERQWARPTVEVNGIFGGYSGKGSKTVLPAWAGAKLTCRLVPDQDPAKVHLALAEHLRRHAPDCVRLTLTGVEHGAPPVVVSREGPAVQAAVRALRRSFGREPVFIREGGSIPLVSHLVQALRAPVLLVGFGRGDDRAHSPNEKFAVEDFYRGILTSACLLEELATLRRP